MDPKVWTQRITIDSGMLLVCLTFVSQLSAGSNAISSRVSLVAAVLSFALAIPLLVFAVLANLLDVWTARTPATAARWKRLIRLAAWLLTSVGVMAVFWFLYIPAGVVFGFATCIMFVLWTRYRRQA